MGERIGALIGSIGGLVFIVVNAGQLPEPTGLVVRLAGVAAFLVVVWFGVIRPGAGPASASRPSRQAMRVYWICVLAEVISIPVGANVINRVFHRPDLVVLWVVAVVGAHFIPFAKAFHAPVFTWLSWTLIALAALGALAGVTVSPQAAPWTAVLAGVALLAFGLFGSRIRRPSGQDQPAVSRPG